MVEKRSETKAIKQRLGRLSFHFSLPINVLFPSLKKPTAVMSIVRKACVLKALQPGYLGAKSNNSFELTRESFVALRGEFPVRAVQFNC